MATWLEDTAITNAYLLSFHSDVPRAEKWTDQVAFRTEIITNCFRIGTEGRQKRKSVAISLVEDNIESEHSLVRMETQRGCVVCKEEGISRVVRRKVLGELSANILPNIKGSGCKKRSIFGCKVCIVSLCKDSDCFARYHNLE